MYGISRFNGEIILKIDSFLLLQHRLFVAITVPVIHHLEPIVMIHLMRTRFQQKANASVLSNVCAHPTILSRTAADPFVKKLKIVVSDHSTLSSDKFFYYNFELLNQLNLNISVGDRVVTRRLCGVAYANQAKDACMKEQVSQSIQREFCEFCETEGW